ncbi:unnamed protein product [Didymodactylos carnosus]|uniref:Uncharacterized protein n=1 Tax=Didymodactylos carnosus TaxID=1234261 RepID=A0A816AH16_9BILA|nr:unnamed protein product [Didymodactylos carnosus]CAF1601225.1 unnamed protein product [Didymodactylos carnosus]CAF4409692.1 unnamed protein product [Didymodactylos carnosus]CAF4472766.1 unnamed protein product [Didymodactylos carnosus]
MASLPTNLDNQKAKLAELFTDPGADHVPAKLFHIFLVEPDGNDKQKREETYDLLLDLLVENAKIQVPWVNAENVKSRNIKRIAGKRQHNLKSKTARTNMNDENSNTSFITQTLGKQEETILLNWIS